MTAASEAVTAWHHAVNAGDIERVLSLSSDDVEVGGPRGAGRGAQLLRDWLERTGIRLESQRVFSGDETVVVVEEVAQWRSADGSLSEPQLVASLFRVREGRVERVSRYDDLHSALEAAGLD
jgi:ketosteroid isomerase-like protein